MHRARRWPSIRAGAKNKRHDPRGRPVISLSSIKAGLAEPGMTPGRKPPGLVTMVLIALAFFCLLLMDPFGIETASYQHSEQAALRVTAPFYDASGDVVVVLIDDDFLARAGKGWPLPYADQGRLLRTIFQGTPAVVYLDILYRQEHGNAADTGEAVTPLDEPMNLLAPIDSFTDTTLIFSAQIQTGPPTSTLATFCPDDPPAETLVLADPDSLLPEFRNWHDSRAGQARVALLGWWGCGDRYPLQLGAEAGQSTPAITMLEAFCLDPDRQQPGCNLLRTAGGAPGSDPFAAPLVVRWGAFPPAQQRQFYSAGVCQPYADEGGGVSAWLAFKTSVTQLLLGIFEDLRNSPRKGLSLPCPAVTVLPASVVRYGDPTEVRALLRDKIVLVGARVTGISDWHQSPVHGQVPGVILHAAATDNLLSLGDRYARDMSSGTTASVAILLLALLAFFVPLLVILLDEPKRRVVSAIGLLCWLSLAGFLSFAGASPESVFAAVVVGIAIDLLMPIQTLIYVLVVLLLGGGAALLIRFGLAPSNWIGMVLVALAFAATVKQFYRQEELKQFPHPVSFLGPAVRPWVEKLDRWHFQDWINRYTAWRRKSPPPATDKVPVAPPPEPAVGEKP